MATIRVALMAMATVAGAVLAAAEQAGSSPETASRAIEVMEEEPSAPVEDRSATAGGEPIRGALRVTQVAAHGSDRLRVVGAGGELNVPGAAARNGDYLLQNEHVSFVISAPQHPNGNAISGGYVIDAFRNDRPVDSLGQLHLYLDNTYPRMANFTSGRSVDAVEPLPSVSSGPMTTPSVGLILEGVDSQDPSIRVATLYKLRQNTNALEIETTVTPTREPLADFQIGDAFAWGATQQFLPGSGFESSGKFFNAPWVGGLGRGVTYGYFGEGGGPMNGPMGSTWIDTNLTTGSARAGESLVSRRKLVVAHDLAEVYKAYLDEAGTSYSEISGTVKESESGRGADGIRINVVKSDGTSVTQALSREDGSFKVWLPEGTYVLSTSDVVRSPVNGPVTLALPAQTGSLDFQVASPAVVSFYILDSETSRPIPSKVRFVGVDGTPTPDLGPAHQVRTRDIVYLRSGQERVAVPAGSYNLIMSRGIEYDMTSVPVVLKRNRLTELTVPLRRVLKPEGMISADFHLHMENSFDSAIPLEDRIISSVGEGLQYAVATDHNYVTDLAPTIEKLKAGDWIGSAIGNEITTRDHFFGHFNAFPLKVQPDKPFNGATPYEKVTAHQLIAGAALGATDPPASPAVAPSPLQAGRVVQVNHPRSGDIGYFDRLHMDPNDATTTHPNWSDKFTAIEVFNGKRTDQFEEVFRDWANLLNLGYAFTATGNSDSHKVYDQEAGYPRNYVILGSQAALRPAEIPVETIVRAVNDRHAVLVTNGPIITLESKGGTGIGGMETNKSGPVEFRVQVQGANFVRPSSISFYGNGELLKQVEFPESPDLLKWEGSFDDNPTSDTWYTVVVRGDESMYPVVSPMVEGKQTLPAVPLAFTNPIWVDRNGDGKFTALNQHHFPMMSEDRSAEALRQLDELTTRSKQRKLPRKKAAPGES